MRKKTRKNKKININQTSFYFEDYIETNKNKFTKKEFISRQNLSIIFFIFFTYPYILHKNNYISLNKIEIYNQEYSIQKFNTL